MNDNYILKDKIPVKVSSITEWGQWMQDNDKERVVCRTQITKEVYVSTVFLGLDHSYIGGAPVLFETMIFGGDLDEYQWRYSTWDEALKGHQEAIEDIFRL